MSPLICARRILLKETLILGPKPSNRHPSHLPLRFKHSVRVIITRDLPEGQMRVYAGEVLDVSAGYARNYLVPKQMAVYATPHNFERCGLMDPALVLKEDANVVVVGGDENEDVVAADVLKKYLKDKYVKMTRNVDPNTPNLCHPGHVSAKNLREQLSKQLKIDLEPHETIHIRNESILGLEDKDEKELMQLIESMDVISSRTDVASPVSDIETFEGEEPEEVAGVETSELKDCDVQVKYLGDYVARITLAGGFLVPLKFRVVKR